MTGPDYRIDGFEPASALVEDDFHAATLSDDTYSEPAGPLTRRRHILPTADHQPRGRIRLGWFGEEYEPSKISASQDAVGPDRWTASFNQNFPPEIVAGFSSASATAVRAVNNLPCSSRSFAFFLPDLPQHRLSPRTASA